ncbi:MAG: GIY-YIG nuclease family protein [Bacteroidetes bacterium]|nr:MAG: GIY-YIG nuclease family protein [Bacteroidota bacterium]
MKVQYVYVLKSKLHWRFYVGMSKDVSNRIKEHNAGRTRSTKGYRPWQLFFTEEYETVGQARTREKYLKSGSGKEYIKARWSHSSAG